MKLIIRVFGNPIGMMTVMPHGQNLTHYACVVT